MSIFRKEKEDPYHIYKPSEIETLENNNVETKEETNPDLICNFEAENEECLLKQDGGNCDGDDCLLWRIWQKQRGVI